MSTAARHPLNSRQANFRRALTNISLGAGPIGLSLFLLAFQYKIHEVAVDFHAAYYPAALRLLDGGNPYAASQHQVSSGMAFVYPALSAIGFAPFALPGRSIGQILFVLVCLACVPAALRALNVRDWRVYGVVLYWLPIYSGWQTANLTLPLMLLVALAWRHRDKPLVAGLITAVAISLKPFVWPLALWLLATRRWKAAAWALASGIVLNLAAWTVVGFNELSTFVHLSSSDTNALWKGGYGMLAVAHHLGASRQLGELLLVLVSALAAAAVIALGLRRDERGALTSTILLMLLASPLLWAHYFALLLVPLALLRPRLAPVWALPILMWPIPPRQPVYGWEEVLAWAVTATVLLLSLRGRASTAAPREPSAVPA